MSKKLFDEENEFLDFENQDESTDSDVEETISTDDDSSGEFQQFGKFAIDQDWLMSTNRESQNPHEEFEYRALEENLYELFNAAPFAAKYEGNKKVSKHEMVEVYLYFLDRISNAERYTTVEKFIAIVNFMKMNFETMYRELPIIHKEAILKELNKKYHIISNKKAHNLF
ncbi:MAG: hypothetical protein WC979_01210 [Candidatus Pacearchaeota archaeon]|jgi:hypothetical protein|nr:hypothetical protein [Clostridia bacterium]